MCEWRMVCDSPKSNASSPRCGGALQFPRRFHTMKTLRAFVPCHQGTGVPPTSICLYHEHLALTGDYPLSHYNLRLRALPLSHLLNATSPLHSHHRGDDKGIVSVRIEQGLLGGGGGCCCCFIPCPPPCLKKKEEGDEDSARDNYYPTT